MAIPGIIDTNSLTNIINSNLSEDFKLKGANKIGQIISEQSTKVSTLILPLALNLAKELGIDPNTLIIPDICPSENTLNTVLPPLNNLINNLNQIGILIVDLNKVIGTVALGGQILQSTSQTLDNISSTLNAAVAIIPPPGLPGAIVSSVEIANKANRKILFKSDGTAKLPPINSAVSSTALKIIVASSVILTVTNILQSIVTLLKQCFPNIIINPVDSSVLTLAESAKSKDQENLLQGYKGFNLEIIEVPFNDKLNQRRAIANNQSGEIILQTELSFTTENSTLITELKSIIDQSGLLGNVLENPLPSTISSSILFNDIDPKIVQDDILKDRIKNTTNQFINQYKILELKNKNINSRNLIQPNFRLPINLDNYSYNLGEFNEFKNNSLNLVGLYRPNDFNSITSTFENLTFLISLTKP